MVCDMRNRSITCKNTFTVFPTKLDKGRMSDSTKFNCARTYFTVSLSLSCLLPSLRLFLLLCSYGSTKK